MTVAQLISELQKHDGDKQVQCWDHLERTFASAMVEPHSKRKQVVLVLARPWHKPWSRP